MVESTVSEFDLIKRYFYALGPRDESVIVGPGDDCAVIVPPLNTKLCCSIDTLVEGVHFPPGMQSKHVATRALGSALSDLAAMGASPSHFTLSLTMPSADAEWLNGFAAALAGMSELYGVALVGGDTTRGPLSVSIQVHGWLPVDAGLMRSGAQPGDLLVVSGTLGDAGAGLKLVLSDNHTDATAGSSEYVLEHRFYCPQPRLELGKHLLDNASSCIDISDGLLSDACHIAQRSDVCLSIDARTLPISSALSKVYPKHSTELALGAGDDYELLFTVKPGDMPDLMKNSSTPLTVIGNVAASVDGTDLELLGAEGLDIKQLKRGYVHFE